MSRADIVYIVSRFPLTTETFIVRELDGLDASGRVLGVLRPTGYRPRFIEHIKELGIEFEERIFGGNQE